MLTISDAYSQNNPIFNGGNADGWAGKSYHQPLNSIYNGGNGDGWAIGNFNQPSNHIYNGGIGDGWVSDSAYMLLDKIIESTFITSISAYPNPTTGNLAVDLGKSYVIFSSEIYNCSGQLIENKDFRNTGSFNLTIEGAKGIYYVKLKTGEESATLQIIKH